MADKVIKCLECKIDFTLSEGEQSFYQSMGYTEPKRCKPCRQQRKAASQGAHANRAPDAPVEVSYAGRGKRRRNSYDD